MKKIKSYLAGFALAVLASAQALAQISFNYFLDYPNSPGDAFRIAPGETKPWVIRTAARGNGGLVFHRFYALLEARENYVFSGNTENCELHWIGAPSEVNILEFRTSIAPNEIRSCSFQVERRLESRSDMLLSPLIFGEPAEIALSVRLIEIDAEQARIYRVHAANQSRWDVAPVPLATNCAALAVPNITLRPYAFEFDYDYPGHCRERLTGCVSFGAMPFTRYGFDTPPISAGGSASCLLRLRRLNNGRAPSAIASLDTYSNRPFFQLPDQSRHYFVSQDQLTIDANALLSQGNISAPGLHHFGALILVLALIAIAARRLNVS